MDLSIIIPVYNEKDNVKELHRLILKACDPLNKTYEVIFVDDGSFDGTYEELKALFPVKIIRLRKNWGQTAALDAGIKAAKGEILITMDGDLQNDPADIPRLLEKMESDRLDVVAGWRRKREDSFSKRFVSKSAKFLRNILIHDGIQDSGCTLRAYKRECFETLDLYGEMHRFIVALLKMRGFKVGEIEVTHHPRKNGKTKYNSTRAVKGFLDMLSVWFWKKFANRPLHLLGTTGILMMLIGVASGSWALYYKIFHNIDMSDTSLTVLTMFLFFSGFAMFIAGILADMVSKTYYASSRDRSYLIEKILDNKADDGFKASSPSSSIKINVRQSDPNHQGSRQEDPRSVSSGL